MTATLTGISDSMVKLLQADLSGLLWLTCQKCTHLDGQAPQLEALEGF